MKLYPLIFLVTFIFLAQGTFAGTTVEYDEFEYSYNISMNYGIIRYSEDRGTSLTLNFGAVWWPNKDKTTYFLIVVILDNELELGVPEELIFLCDDERIILSDTISESKQDYYAGINDEGVDVWVSAIGFKVPDKTIIENITKAKTVKLKIYRENKAPLISVPNNDEEWVTAIEEFLYETEAVKKEHKDK
jgi:hypothetical protein